jgi:hypothetical protein
MVAVDMPKCAISVPDAITVFAGEGCILFYDAHRQFPDPAIAIRRKQIL